MCCKTWKYGFYKSLFCHKGIEVDLKINKPYLGVFDLNVNLSFKGDHAGFYFFFAIFRYGIEINIQDSRHWDYENNEWEK